MITRLSAAVLAIAAPAALGDVLEATSTWTSGTGANGHTYMLFSVNPGVTWEAAEASAVSLGGTLATITSANENTFVYNALGIASNNNVWYLNTFNASIGPWLGAFQPDGSAEPAGGYQWVTGEAFSYTNWSPNEPNNSGGTENRAHYYGLSGRSGAWNDITNTVLVDGYVVEVAPAPASLALLIGAGLAAGRRRR